MVHLVSHQILSEFCPVTGLSNLTMFPDPNIQAASLRNVKTVLAKPTISHPQKLPPEPVRVTEKPIVVASRCAGIFGSILSPLDYLAATEAVVYDLTEPLAELITARPEVRIART